MNVFNPDVNRAMHFRRPPLPLLSAFRFTRAAAALAGMGLLASCSLAPEVERPVPALPAQWELSAGQEDTFTRWWKRYDDAALDALIDRALAHNADLHLAAARVAESRALLGGKQAEQYPDISANASAARLEMGDTLQQGGTIEHYGIGPMLSFEVDLWGRLANATEAARQQLLAEQANARAVRLAVIADTASHYFAATALNEQIAITRRTTTTRTSSLRLQRRLFAEGEIDALPVRQAESELRAVEAELPNLENQRQQRISALSVLTGASPAELFRPGHLAMVKDGRLPALPALPALTPEQVVAGRPDIVRAEHGLIASHAQIGVARAAYLPRLSLTGLVNFQSDTVGDLFSDSPATGLVGSLMGPVLDFGRARAQVEASEARQKQAYITYEQTIRVAFREILDALGGYRTGGERLKAQDARITSLRHAVRLAQRRYREGESNYIDVLDAERNLYQAEAARIETRRVQLQSSADLYKALGGGAMEEEPAPIADAVR